MKYRSREIVEAVQWVPGSRVSGVMQLDADTAVLDNRAWTRGKIAYYGLPLEEVKSGDYILTHANGRRQVIARDEFCKRYEEIGG